MLNGRVVRPRSSSSRQPLSQAEPLSKISQSALVASVIVVDPKIRVYGMARPSFRRRSLAGRSGGGRDGYLCARRRPRQERLQRGWAGCVRRGFVMRRKVRRETLIALAEKLPPCVVGMEGLIISAACSPPTATRRPADVAREYVQPYINAQKNDDRDAEGIAEAVTRPTMRFCRTEEPGPTRHADTSSIARPVGRGADSSDQSVARHSAGARGWSRRRASGGSSTVPGRADG